ncbi:hypothetical protein PG984_010404 [Apiospora sp. TS-2023a]
MAHDPGSDQNHFAVFRKAVRPVLAPGPYLNTMFQRSFRTMSLSLDAQLTSAEPIKVDLLAWIRHEITLAGTDAEYGEANPFRDPSIEESWQTFVSGLPVLVGGVLPRVFARKSILARERLVQRFLDYFKQGHHITGGSGAVHVRLRHNAAAGMPLADTARGEVGACMAFLNNTVPGAFWVLYHIYADPAVLRDVREELLAHAVVKDDDSDHHTLNVESVLSACPVLRSTVHEVFRVRGIGTGMVRRVLADQPLGDSGYLLKKGGWCSRPTACSIWIGREPPGAQTATALTTGASCIPMAAAGSRARRLCASLAAGGPTAPAGTLPAPSCSCSLPWSRSGRIFGRCPDETGVMSEQTSRLAWGLQRAFYYRIVT